MERVRYELFDPLLGAAQADEMLRLCERFGSYGMYGQKPIETGIGAGLAQRHDAARNFVLNGGRFARDESPEVLAARTNYFRESYAYAQPFVDGIESFHAHDGFIEAARSVYDRPMVVPAIVYANLLVPGQELAVHTDVPEFRGTNRTKDPEWLLVAMHHSGLFDDWRIPIATGVAWFNTCRGGEFVYYPAGKDAPPETLAAKHDTAIVLDTDSCFHGVDRVAETRESIPALLPGMRLTYEGDTMWRVGPAGQTLARYHWDELRFSVSWKAYCFRDEAEERAWREHSDDLPQQRAVDRLIEDLRQRGRIEGDVPDPTTLALLMIDEYIRFPPSVAAGTAAAAS